MGFKWMVILVILLIELILIGESYGVVGGDSLSRKKFLDAEGKINIHKQLSLKSIKSEDGDIIDCIDIYKQPAFDHPGLRNHSIQMTPSYDPTIATSTTTEKETMTVTSQLWQKSGRCPKGTIPIRRTRREVLLKANSVENFGRKKMKFLHKAQQLNDSKTSYLEQANHSLAILLTVGYSYSGAKGDIKVWTPFVEFDDEYSTSQISLKNGPYYDYESIESGWAVNPSVYGDRQTRLFVYWTVDASNTTGCFDLTCPGFVQTSSEIALGAAINPISIPGGLSYQITLFIFKDPNTSNWWVQYGEKINIGYWPSNLFRGLSLNAETVQWGGEVYSSKVGTSPHTTTEMGTGHYASPWADRSGWVKRIRIRDNSMVLKFPEWVYSHADEYDCYDVFYVGDYIEDPEFYYGGPGRNYMCP